jgi:hypothetical protein
MKPYRQLKLCYNTMPPGRPCRVMSQPVMAVPPAFHHFRQGAAIDGRLGGRP